MLTRAEISFEWLQCDAGFEWVWAFPVDDDWTIVRSRPTWVLVARRSIEDVWQEPLSRASGLFQELATCEVSREGILDFAQRHGTLTIGRLYAPAGLKVRMPRPPSEVRLTRTRAIEEPPALSHWINEALARGAVIGESIDVWNDSIVRLGALMRLWKAIREDDAIVIYQHVHLVPDGSDTRILLTTADGVPLTDHRLPARADDPLEWAEFVLRTSVEVQLFERCSIGLGASHASRPGHLVITPPTLKDAIWLQFGMAVQETKNFRPCEVCGRWFEISPQFARTNRTLCSAACKAKAFRLRHARALELASQGKTARKIAKEVGSKLSTVQNWLAANREKKTHGT